MRHFARFCALVLVAFFFAISADFNRAQAQTPTPTPSPTPPPVQAGQVIISEFRLRGPDGDGNGPLTAGENEFVELYNNTDSPIIVNALDTSAGWSVVISDGNITGAIFSIPNGTVIPARGHLLGANVNGYSLCNYPSGSGSISTAAPSIAVGPCVTNGIGGTFTHTTPDRTWDFNVPDGSGVALFATTDGTKFTSAALRLDAVGFTSSPALFREGSGIASVVTANAEHTYYRDLRTGGLPRDTGDNAADFLLVGTSVNLQVTRLGAPGPENLNSPIVNNATINASLLDPAVSSSTPPNRVRSLTTEDPNLSLFGTLLIRRTIKNNTGLPLTRLRFRIINITTDGTPGSECEGGTCADLHALTSEDEPTVMTSQGTVSVRGLRLEEPPDQPAGGGYNSSLSADFITPASPSTSSIDLNSPLPDGQSINVVFKLGVMRTGPFRFFVNFEAQNGTSLIVTAPASGTNLAKDSNTKKVVADTVRSAPGAAPASPAPPPSAAPGNVYAPLYIYLPPTPAADDEEEKEDEGKEKKSEETPPSAEPAPPTPAADPPTPAADEAAPQPAEAQRAPQKKQPAAAKASKRGEQ